MKALVATGYGQPADLVVADLPIPRPGPGQIQVRIAAATINPTDIRATAGGFRAMVELEFPYVLGTDFAGTVTETGPGVTAYRVGDEVFGQALPRALSIAAAPTRPSLSTGALAEYAVFEADTPMLAHRPPELPADQAAALAIPGATALAIMHVAAIGPGDRVLVIGATGGVGTVVLPLLAKAGATVIATASGAERGRFLGELGAHEITGYTDYPTDVDVVLNLTLFADALAPAVAALRPGGRFVSIIFPPLSPEQIGRDDIEVHFVMDLSGTHSDMRAVAAGDLTAVIAARHSLNDAVQAAINYSTGHPLGKVVVTMDADAPPA
ncbi:NADP-dependent oxidoreductase [Actinoplanes couchii]|uniref:NADPH:quinone reductase n=1 Tax=Actinoplanes couchii TaxID=403638 RepID=A0ABQ3XKE3_9ACTN|nr:NADP-dependent oxidoreductase [Actinoplanes couchii]MDR6320574.1 NADPH:quinone reductase-like Zn-dependent oxidoreductase [Actinoplanes couchii]GID58977.1 NADPH:quinone reductase [Actinoplanes couchii]